jgi:hypothetical protein
MRLNAGARWKCTNRECGSEIVVALGAKIEGFANLRCCCGSVMKQPYARPVLKTITDPADIERLLGKQEQAGDVMDTGSQDLIPDESVVGGARIHRIQLLWPSILTGFLGLIAVFLFSGAISSHGSYGGTWILVAGALTFLITAIALAAITFAKWQSRKVILTDKRLIVISGVFGERTSSIFISTIESVVVQQGFLGGMLGFGTVILRDREGTVHRLKKIVRPTEFLRHLQGVVGQGGGSKSHQQQCWG